MRNDFRQAGKGGTMRGLPSQGPSKNRAGRKMESDFRQARKGGSGERASPQVPS